MCQVADQYQITIFTHEEMRLSGCQPFKGYKRTYVRVPVDTNSSETNELIMTTIVVH